MSAYLKSQGCALVGFERSMWCVTINGHTLLIAAHIDDFILACADRDMLDTFRTNLLARFDGTYEGAAHTYLGCEIERDILRDALSSSSVTLPKTSCVPSRCGTAFRHLRL